MVVRSYDNVLILSEDNDSTFANGNKVTILNLESFIEGEVQDSSEEEGWKSYCITIAADYGAHPQLGRGSKIDRLYLGGNNQNAKLYYPPKDYYTLYCGVLKESMAILILMQTKMADSM